MANKTKYFIILFLKHIHTSYKVVLNYLNRQIKIKYSNYDKL